MAHLDHEVDVCAHKHAWQLDAAVRMRALLHDTLRTRAWLAQVLLLPDTFAHPARCDTRQQIGEFVLRWLHHAQEKSAHVGNGRHGTYIDPVVVVIEHHRNIELVADRQKVIRTVAYLTTAQATLRSPATGSTHLIVLEHEPCLHLVRQARAVVLPEPRDRGLLVAVHSLDTD